MLSEKSYWFVLIVGLCTFIVIDYLWIVPIHEGFGVNLLTDAIFMVFTIVFLTWVISFREARKWRIVGSKIRERIEYRLFKIFSDISAYFLEPTPQMLNDLEKGLQGTDRMDEGIEREKAIASSLVKYYASKETVELGEFVKAFFEQPNKDVATYLIESFKRESDFLEHIVSEYSGFLPPDLMNSIMEIEDCLDEVINVLWVISMLGVQSPIDKKRSESELQSSIHKITKEIDQLNEMRLGFSPT